MSSPSGAADADANDDVIVEFDPLLSEQNLAGKREKRSRYAKSKVPPPPPVEATVYVTNGRSHDHSERLVLLGGPTGPRSVPNYSSIYDTNPVADRRPTSLGSGSIDSDFGSRSLLFCIHGNKWGMAECCDNTLRQAGRNVDRPSLDYNLDERIDPNRTATPEKKDTPSPAESGIHCHDEVGGQAVLDIRVRNKLILASVLCIAFMIAEVIGGLLANSLAIMTDAAHLLSDFASFMISLVSIYVATKPASARFNFGWHRFEVVGAIISVLLIWVLTGALLAMACIRLMNGNYNDIDDKIMLITSGVGLVVNIIMGLSLHGGTHGHSHGMSHSHDANTLAGSTVETGGVDRRKSHNVEGTNINVRAAMIHVIGDFIQSLGVFVAALFIYFFEGTGYLDPICTVFFSVIVLFTTFNILREVFGVLMEAIPKGVDFEVVKSTFMGVSGIRAVHNIRIWGLTTEKFALAAHLAIESTADAQEILREATAKLRAKYNFFEMTLQVELFQDVMNNCKQCENPKN